MQDIYDSFALFYSLEQEFSRFSKTSDLVLLNEEETLEVSDRFIDVFKKSYDVYNQSNHFFVNPSGTPLSDQTVRRMINKYTSLAAIEQHITPHMFRRTFASSLLDADVDIRYIQEMLGHSSINTTQIYTHVTMAKQKNILTTKHSRNKFNF